MQRLARCQTLDDQGRYAEAIVCYTKASKQIVHADERQPLSSETERLNRVAEPSPIGILIVLGIIYFLTR